MSLLSWSFQEFDLIHNLFFTLLPTTEANLTKVSWTWHSAAVTQQHALLPQLSYDYRFRPALSVVLLRLG